MAKLTNKSFWLGLAVGIGISAGIVAMLFAFGSYYGKRTSNDLRTEFENLMPMAFPREPTAPLCNAMDSTWVLRDFSGNAVTLADFRGKVLFVDFWATWCESCTIEMPSIIRLQQRVRGLPIEFLFVTNEDRRRVEAFLKKNKLSIPVYLAEKSPPSAFATPALPTSFIINGDGVIVYRHIGMGKWDDDAAEQFLRQLTHLSAGKIAKNLRNSR